MAATKYAEEEATYTISFFEIYGGKLFDLLNGKKKLTVQEDYNQKIQITGLKTMDVDSESQMNEIIEYGNSVRVTHATQANDESSRSHAICQVNVYSQARRGAKIGQLMLVDLAGSERGQDTTSNNRIRRLEGAEINKSLLALKECIRAFGAKKKGSGKVHVPFRASKLTLVLRDSFISQKSAVKIVMIACIGPSSFCSDHTLNTLRYASRLKTSAFVQGKSSNANRKALPQIYKPKVRLQVKDDFDAVAPPTQKKKRKKSSTPQKRPPLNPKDRAELEARAGEVGAPRGRGALKDAGAVIMRQGSIQNIKNGRPVSSRRSDANGTEESYGDLTAADSKQGEQDDIDYLRKTVKGLEGVMINYADKVGDVVEEQD